MRRVIVFGLVCAIASCGDSTAPSTEGLVLPDVRGVVVGNALAALDHNGRFRPAEPWSPSDRPLMSPERALALADQYLREVVLGPPDPNCLPSTDCIPVRAALGNWCRHLDPERVRTADHWFFGVPPTGEAADSIDLLALHRRGPRYFIPVLHGSDWVGTIAVAAHATVARVDEVEMHAGGLPAHNEFEVASGACHVHAGVPPAPEQAVAYAAAVTGRKVVEVPTLILAGVTEATGRARWRVVLDAPVTVRTLADGWMYETAELYVSVAPNRNENANAWGPTGTRLRISIASESQPEFDEWREIRFPRRPEAPLHFKEVVVVR